MNQADRIARFAETDRAAQEIMDKERQAREEKTRRLRQARLGGTQQERQVEGVLG